MAITSVRSEWTTPGAMNDQIQRRQAIMELRNLYRQEQDRKAQAASVASVPTGLTMVGEPTGLLSGDARGWSDMQQRQSDIANLESILGDRGPLKTRAMPGYGLPEPQTAGPVQGGPFGPGGTVESKGVVGGPFSAGSGLDRAMRERMIGVRPARGPAPEFSDDDEQHAGHTTATATAESAPIIASPARTATSDTAAVDPMDMTGGTRGRNVGFLGGTGQRPLSEAVAKELSPETQRKLEQALEAASMERIAVTGEGLSDLGFGAGRDMIRRAIYEPPITVPQVPFTAGVPHATEPQAGTSLTSTSLPFAKAAGGYQQAAEGRAKSLADILHAGGGITPREEAEYKVQEAGAGRTAPVERKTWITRGGKPAFVGQSEIGPGDKPYTAAPDPMAKIRTAGPVLDSIAELSEKINTQSGLVAKMSGGVERAAAKANLDDDTAEYLSLVSGFTPLVARALGHTGVLTQQDVDSVKELFPKPGDSKSLRDRKVARIRKILDALGSGGEPRDSLGLR